ncbi:MAG: NAD(P)H-hydrate dehydratase [Clostridia bacterium]|nr:NAD(P)H-hydrate dehydratase [Clostridia bacterium]
MINVSTAELMRSIDRHMIEDIGIPSAVLMENAARAVSDTVLKCGKSGLCAILIGPGNNGGDGLCVLRQLAQAGRSAIGILLCDPAKLKGDALLNYSIAKRLGLLFTDSLDPIESAEIIVDALFGTGLDREITGKQQEAIHRANGTSAYRIAVDIPSGINGTSGRAMGEVFRADETVTFVAMKRGHLLTRELECIGRLSVANIGMTDEAHKSLLENEQLIDREFVDSLLPERKKYSNKGTYGKALMICGNNGMPGAAVMAANACIRAGAGLTRAMIHKSIIPAFSVLPEAMLVSDDEIDLDSQLDWASAVCIGCGIGNDVNKRNKLEKVLESRKRAVLDADALNLMASDRVLLSHLNADHVITPHPGEMARLMKLDIQEVLDDPVGAALGFSKTYGCTMLLKNAVSVIASPDGRLRYNSSGNTGLSKGGSGDCLAGIITAFLAQGLSPFDAASAGAYLLGAAADEALALLKTRVLTTSDTASAIESLLNSRK